MRLALVLVLAAPAHAQDLFVVRHGPAALSSVDAADGSLLDPVAVDVDALAGLGGGTDFVWDCTLPGNGELWVTDFTNSAIHRLSADGTSFLGDVPTGSTLGAATFGPSVWANSSSGGSSGAGVYEFDPATGLEVGAIPQSSIYDLFEYNGQLLASLSSGSIVVVDTANGQIGGTFATPGGFLEQMALASNGNLLVSNFNGGVFELSPAGAVVRTLDPGIGNVRGVAELGTGDLLVAGPNGVYVFDPVVGTSTLVDAGSSSFVVPLSDPTIGTNYCTAVPNSTGVPGVMSATGSTSVASNSLSLIASDLPANSFGYFLASRTQGFVQNPGGSAGNLCLAGTISRFAQQVQSSGPDGSFTIQADLTAFPNPAGPPIAVQVGETWSFQSWHRDSDAMGQPTSNFTDGLAIDFD